MPQQTFSLNNAQQQAAAKFANLSKIHDKISGIEDALRPLAALGASVTKNDVFEQVVKLISNGHFTAQEAAKELMTMPGDGPALPEWIQRHTAGLARNRQQIAPAHEQARQQLGNTSLALMAQHLAAAGQNA